MTVIELVCVPTSELSDFSTCCHPVNKLTLPVEISVANQWAIFNSQKVNVNDVDIIQHYVLGIAFIVVASCSFRCTHSLY